MLGLKFQLESGHPYYRLMRIIWYIINKYIRNPFQ